MLCRICFQKFCKGNLPFDKFCLENSEVYFCGHAKSHNYLVYLSRVIVTFYFQKMYSTLSMDNFLVMAGQETVTGNQFKRSNSS